MESLVDLGMKSEPDTSNQFHGTAGASTDFASTFPLSYNILKYYSILFIVVLFQRLVNDVFVELSCMPNWHTGPSSFETTRES